MKILVKIKNNKLCFINRKKLNSDYKNMLNTNVISNNELVFSDEYIILNQKIITTFLNELVKTYNLSTLTFQNLELLYIFLPFLSKIKGINSLYIESNEVMPYKVCEKLNKINIKYISFEYIPKYMFEILDKSGHIPESRNEILFTSLFMQTNNLNNYSSIYYKNNIYLQFPLSYEDINDFNVFCDINKNLKVIHINKLNKVDLEKVLKIIIYNKKRNIKIYLHGDEHESDAIEYLKKNNKVLKKKYKISFSLKYSNKYISENIAKETNNTVLRMIALLILIIIIFSFIYIFYDNYKSMMKVSKIQNDVVKYINAKDTEEINTTKVLNGLEVKNNYIYSLKDINNDITSWLKVNNTNIDYPIVKTDNNLYYLDYNLKKEKDPNGWLFLDYRTSDVKLDDNTIIYGHNRFVNGVMFGTLHKTLYKNWYTDKENQIINYDTVYGSYQFKIFSIYIVPTTTDYIKTNFDSDDEKQEFLNKIKGRSIYDFKVDVDVNTKVLTLSTCQSDTTRLVLHAALINKTDEN